MGVADRPRRPDRASTGTTVRSVGAGSGARDRRAGHRRTAATFAAIALLVVATACTSDQADETGTASSSAALDAVVRSSIPLDDERAIRAAIERLNASAAGSVADQRSALAGAVDPALAGALDQCPTATSTLRFEYDPIRA